MSGVELQHLKYKFEQSRLLFFEFGHNACALCNEFEVLGYVHSRAEVTLNPSKRVFVHRNCSELDEYSIYTGESARVVSKVEESESGEHLNNNATNGPHVNLLRDRKDSAGCIAELATNAPLIRELFWRVIRACPRDDAVDGSISKVY